MKEEEGGFKNESKNSKYYKNFGGV